MSSTADILANGWTAAPINAQSILSSIEKLAEAYPYTVQGISFPDKDPLVIDAQAFAKGRLSAGAYNHSMRVYYWGHAIATRFLPEQFSALSSSTWALTCLLHDIGTAEAFFTSTHMSFDLYGGIKAMEVLKALGSTTDQAEAVAEAIIRHQDLGTEGNITFLGQLIQLGTLYDNAGAYDGIPSFGDWVHIQTRADVNEAFPRHKWSHSFACTIRQEEANKPWCHSTHIKDFPEVLEANTLMAQWD